MTYYDGRWQPVRPVSIFDCLDDDALWGDGKFFRDPDSWKSWWTFLKVLFGEPLTLSETHFFRRCTGRTGDPSIEGYREAHLICGRKSGKSRVLALVSVFLAVYRDWSEFLSPGEVGCIKIVANDRRQARTIFRYCRAFLAHCSVLAHLIESDRDDALHLSNGIVIEVQTASFRSIRGYTVITSLCDEIAFWRSEDSLNPDQEIIDALKPAMATIPNSLLLTASSPYARRGYLWEQYRRYFGQDDDRVLVWQAPTLVMNPTVPQAEIDDAYTRDWAWADSEFGAQFRNDLEGYVTREVVDACTQRGVRELPPIPGTMYQAFVDPSGGSGDSFAIAIAHGVNYGTRGILDAVRERRPPFSPESVVREYADLLRSYGIFRVVGDRYGGQWPQERFAEHGIKYEPAQKTKSELYVELLPLLNSKRVELLDHPVLLNQITSLERRTGRGTGRDSIDHPVRQHDDLANVCDGVLNLVASGDERSVVVRRYLLGSRAA